MRWNEASYEIPALSDTASTLAALADLMSALEKLSKTSTALMKIVSAFKGEFDIKSMAIQAAIDAASLTLQDLLQPAMGHALLVPPIPPFERKPAAPVIPVRGFGDFAYGALLNKTGLPELLGDGGNYGLYRKFIESLFDDGDYSRPAFSNDAYVAGGILLVGSPNYLAVARAMLNMSRFFGDDFPTPMDEYRMPVPQNVKAKPVAVPRSVAVGTEPVLSLAGLNVPQGATVKTLIAQRPTPPGEYAVRMSWDKTPSLKFDLRLSSKAPVSYRIVSTHIFVNKNTRIKASDDLSLREVYRVNTPSATLQLPIAQAATVSAPLSSVIVHGFDAASDYYFSVGYTVEMRLGDDVEVFPPTYSTLSAQVRVNLSQQAPYKKFVEGRAPDWIAINNPIAFAPGVQDLIAKVQAVIDAVSSTYAGYRNEVSALLQSAEEAIGAIRAKLDELLALVSNLADAQSSLLTSDIGAYATVFTGQGGVPYMMRTVGELLLSKSVENRPPFDRGDEAVAAIIFVAGSDTAAGVAAFLASLNVLLGPTNPGGFTVIDSVNRIPAVGDAFAPNIGIGVGPSGDSSSAPVRQLGISGPADDPC